MNNRKTKESGKICIRFTPTTCYRSSFSSFSIDLSSIDLTTHGAALFRTVGVIFVFRFRLFGALIIGAPTYLFVQLLDRRVKSERARKVSGTTRIRRKRYYILLNIILKIESCK